MKKKVVSILLLILILLLSCFAFALTQVVVINPLSEQNVSGTILLNATTDLPAVNVTFHWQNRSGDFVLNTTIHNTSNTYFHNASFDTTLLPDGRYNITVNATNSSGGTVTVINTTIVNVTVDNTAPQVFIHTANVSNFSSDSPVVNYNFTDNLSTVANCTVYINGIVNASNTTVLNGSLTNMTLFYLSDGNHTYYFNCTDTASNTGMSSIYSVSIDKTAPSVTIVTPANATNVSSDNYVFNVTVTDAAFFVDTVQFNISNGTGYIVINASSPAAGQYNASFNLTLLGEELHNVTIRANDTFNNINITVYTMFTVDRTAPIVEVITGNGTNFSTATPVINFNYTDNLSRISNCTVYVDDVAIVSNASIRNGTISNFTLSAQTQGNHSYYVNCTDSSGNIGMSKVYNMTVDSLVPVVNIVTPTNGTNLTSDIYVFNVTVTDATSVIDTVQFNISNGTGYIVINASSPAAGQYNASFNLTLLGEEVHNLTVRANDTLNNINMTEYNIFTVDRTAPNVTIRSSSFSVTTSLPSIDFNFTDDLSKTANCTLILNDTKYGSLFGVVNATITSIIPNASLSTQYYSVTVNCTDGSGNEGNSSARVMYVDLSSGPTSSSGLSGGGSGGSVTQTVVQEQVTIKLDINDEAIFDVAGVSHSVEINNLYKDHVRLEIHSPGKVIVDLYLGKPKKIDVDSDGILDLEATLKELTAFTAKITFKLISERVATAPKITLPVVEGPAEAAAPAPVEAAPVEEEVEEEKIPLSSSVWIIIGIALLGLAIGLFIKFKKKGRR